MVDGLDPGDLFLQPPVMGLDVLEKLHLRRRRSHDEHGVRKGYSLAYGLRNLLTPKQLQDKGEPYRPYRTVAAWYCWQAVHEQRNAPQ